MLRLQLNNFFDIWLQIVLVKIRFKQEKKMKKGKLIKKNMKWNYSKDWKNIFKMKHEKKFFNTTSFGEKSFPHKISFENKKKTREKKKKHKTWNLLDKT